MGLKVSPFLGENKGLVASNLKEISDLVFVQNIGFLEKNSSKEVIIWTIKIKLKIFKIWYFNIW